MKRTFLFLAIALVTQLSFSQTSVDQDDVAKGTTLEEYNYMTKGYSLQQSSGLDMKKGYNLESISNLKRGYYSFSFNALIRTEEKEFAGILIIANSQVSGRNYHLALPVNNSQLQPKFENDINSWDESMTTAFSQALSELYSNTAMSCYLEMNK